MAAAAAKSLQSCLTLCDPIDGNPPGSSIPGILQERILEWVAISFSNACMHACMLSRFSCVQPCVTLCTAAHQAPPSTGFSRQEYWSGSPFPSPLQVANGDYKHRKLDKMRWNKTISQMKINRKIFNKILAN